MSAPTGMMDEGETEPSWYRPAPTEGAQPPQAPVPPPGQTFPPQLPQFVPVAPGPVSIQDRHVSFHLLIGIRRRSYNYRQHSMTS